MIWYYAVHYSTSSYVLTVPGIIKNLFMFPIESVVLTLFLRFIQPITYRMKLTYAPPSELKFSKAQIALLVVLVILGTGCVGGYLNYHYENTSVTTGYTKEEVVEMNHKMHEIVVQREHKLDNGKTLAVIEFAKKPFLGEETTYTVAIYEAVEGAEITDAMWGYKKTPASKDKNLVRLATATIVVNNKSDRVLSYELVYVR